jgi:hypothetical protein
MNNSLEHRHDEAMVSISHGPWRTDRLGSHQGVRTPSALLGDGVWDALSWVTLAMPLAVIAWKYGGGRIRD